MEQSVMGGTARAPIESRCFHAIEVLWCDIHGVYVNGWIHANDTPVHALFIRSGDARLQVAISDRPELFNFFPDLVSAKCGFAAYLPCAPFTPVSLELQTADGNVIIDVRKKTFPDLDPPPDQSDGHMTRFTAEMKKKGGRVVEIGSRVVGPESYLRANSFKPECEFIGVDIHDAEGVDVVADAHFLEDHFEKGSLDGIFSLAVVEHLACPWLVAAQINKVLKIGGLTLHVVPHTFPVHEMPNDFWRMSSEGLRVLFSPSMGFEVVEIGMTTPVRVMIHPDFRGGAFLDMPRHESMATSYIVARKTRNIADNAVAWPLERTDSGDQSRAYPKH